MLAERGTEVSCENVGRWSVRFGDAYVTGKLP